MRRVARLPRPGLVAWARLMMRAWWRRGRERGYLECVDRRVWTELAAQGHDAEWEVGKPFWRG